MKPFLRLSFSVLALVFLTHVRASANDTSLNVSVSPPRPVVDGETPVRMKAERLKIFVGWRKSRVEVEFDLENLSKDDYSGWVGFPDEDLLVKYARYAADSASGDRLSESLDARVEADFGDVSGTISDFKAWVLTPAGSSPAKRSELPVKVLRIVRTVDALDDPSAFPDGKWQPAGEESGGSLDSLTVCRAFQLNWKPMQTLTVGHSYETDNGTNVLGQLLFQYTLSTGKNWSGTIGSADIDVFLDDGLTVDDIYFGGDGSQEYSAPSSPSRKQWTVVTDTHLALRWKDFEPEGDRSEIFIATNDGAHLSLKPALRKNMQADELSRYDEERKANEGGGK